MSANTPIHKILVVDDDPVIRDMMVDILSFEEGYSVEQARNGREALEKLQGPDSYIVFLDLMMPVMDGRAFCQQLNADPQLRKRHVIIIMSAMDKLSEANALQADATLPKPFEFDDAIRALQPYRR